MLRSGRKVNIRESAGDMPSMVAKENNRDSLGGGCAGSRGRRGDRTRKHRFFALIACGEFSRPEKRIRLTIIQLGDENTAIGSQDRFTAFDERDLRERVSAGSGINARVLARYLDIEILKNLNECRLETRDLETILYPADKPDRIHLQSNFLQ